MASANVQAIAHELMLPVDSLFRAEVKLRDEQGGGGAILTTVANSVAKQVLKRRSLAGVGAPAASAEAAGTPTGEERSWRPVDALALLNRAFLVGAVAATPYFNFALFNDYRPHPIRRFFTF